MGIDKIFIYGASGHGLVVADIAEACGYENIILIDDGDNDFPTFEEIKDNTDIPLAFGIGDNAIRQKLFDKVRTNGFTIATLIHPSSIISSNVTIGTGTVIMPRVVVNTHTTIGNGVILNTGCIIEHECIIQDFVHISPAVALAGNVTVNELAHVGIGSSIIQGITIGKQSIIGAGSIVVKSIPQHTLCYGNPCKKIRSIK